MSIDTKTTGPIPAELLADGEAIVEAIRTGRKPDPEIAKRVRDRAAKISAEVRKKHGVLDIGSKFIREFRDA